MGGAAPAAAVAGVRRERGAAAACRRGVAVALVRRGAIGPGPSCRGWRRGALQLAGVAGGGGAPTRGGGPVGDPDLGRPAAGGRWGGLRGVRRGAAARRRADPRERAGDAPGAGAFRHGGPCPGERGEPRGCPAARSAGMRTSRGRETTASWRSPGFGSMEGCGLRVPGRSAHLRDHGFRAVPRGPCDGRGATGPFAATAGGLGYVDCAVLRYAASTPCAVRCQVNVRARATAASRRCGHAGRSISSAATIAVAIESTSFGSK